MCDKQIVPWATVNMLITALKNNHHLASKLTNVDIGSNDFKLFNEHTYTSWLAN